MLRHLCNLSSFCRNFVTCVIVGQLLVNVTTGRWFPNFKSELRIYKQCSYTFICILFYSVTPINSKNINILLEIKNKQIFRKIELIPDVFGHIFPNTTSCTVLIWPPEFPFQAHIGKICSVWLFSILMLSLAVLMWPFPRAGDEDGNLCKKTGFSTNDKFSKIVAWSRS